MNLTHDDVREILRLLDGSPFDELHLETERFKLTLRRGAVAGWTQETRTLAAPRVARPDGVAAATSASSAASAMTSGNASTASASPAKAASTGQATGATGAQLSIESVVDVRTPIIGTFYRAPKPGAPPFVEVGSDVTAETVIGIIETMKLMNSVYAGAPGKVIDICAGDGKFVEQDQVLMRLRRDRE